MNADRLRDLVAYDPESGVMIHRRAIAGRPVGTPAAYVMPNGYVSVKLDGVRYYVHRLAWLYMYGEWPKGCIDHLNGDRSDNRVSNLRDVTASVNNQNLRSARSHNRLGVLGVQQKRKAFQARIAINGKTTCLGTFSTPEEASAAYWAAKQQLHAI